MVDASSVDHVKGEAVVRDPAEHPRAASGTEEHLGEKVCLSLLLRHLIAGFSLNGNSMSCT